MSALAKGKVQVLRKCFGMATGVHVWPWGCWWCLGGTGDLASPSKPRPSRPTGSCGWANGANPPCAHLPSLVPRDTRGSGTSAGGAHPSRATSAGWRGSPEQSHRGQMEGLPWAGGPGAGVSHPGRWRGCCRPRCALAGRHQKLPIRSQPPAASRSPSAGF